RGNFGAPVRAHSIDCNAKSTKTRKRKRTYAPSRQAQAPAAVEQTPSVASETTIVLSWICTVNVAEALKGE
ncbi:hypothetical protein, partial [Salmonella enterica]|uniref:hypothetical protein n=1 Tax=Salmonella enterica TaxID=28901 RepID=UPI003299931D